MGFADCNPKLDAISTTRGATLYRGASGWAAQSPGTTGQVEVTGGAGSDPFWSWASQQNRLANSSFAVWQRQPGTESTDTSYNDDTYAADRINILTQTASVQCSRQAGDVRSRYCLRLKQNQATAQRMGWEQILEAQDSIDYRGEAVRLQGKVKCSSSQAIRFAILEWTGTADSVTSDVVASWTSSTYTAGNFFLSSNLTVTAVGSITPSAATWTAFSLTGTVSTSCNNLIVMVWVEGTAVQNVTLDSAEVGLYLGAEGKVWQPSPVGVEQMRLYRYFRRMGGASELAGAIANRQSTNLIVGKVLIAPEMRVIPTLSNSSPTWSTSPTGNQIGFLNTSANAYATITGTLDLTLSAANPNLFSPIIVATTISGSTGNSGRLDAGGTCFWNLDAEL